MPCQGCGGPHQFDTSIPSPVWNRVIRARELPENLCASCILAEFAKADCGFTATLWANPDIPAVAGIPAGQPIAVSIGGSIATASAELVEENNRLRSASQRLQAYVAHTDLLQGLDGICEPDACICGLDAILAELELT